MALKELIFHKPATRGVCIPSVLRFTYHSDNDVRTKAVRLASNLLWPDPAFQPTIEAFAKEVGYRTINIDNVCFWVGGRGEWVLHGSRGLFVLLLLILLFW